MADGSVWRRDSGRSRRAGAGRSQPYTVEVGPLSVEEREELDLIVSMRDQEAANAAMRARLVAQGLDGTVRARARVWLVDEEIHRALHERREDDPEIAVEAHRGVEVREFDVSIGRCPLGGADWQAINAPRKVRDATRELFDQLRQALVRTVIDTIESGALSPADAASNAPEVVLADADPQTRARAEAFVDEMQRMGTIAADATTRLRYEALRTKHGSGRTWRERRAIRKHDALLALDAMRAMQAAICEVDAAVQLAWARHDLPANTVSAPATAATMSELGRPSA
ncbi:MAG TPA: hypothetical protein VGM78_03085 [Ilumatobacteraceae bacterium]